MNIGNVKLSGNVFLAPMAGVTDLAFRTVCHRFGAALSYTEMVSAKAFSFGDEKTKALLETNKLPTAVQLFGHESNLMGEVIKDAENFGLFTDINMGCPAPKITGNGEGSALMKNLSLAQEILESVCQNAKKPVTVKIRSGWDGEHINAVELARIAQSCSVKAITVHARTREQFYSGKADRSLIKKVCESVCVPVIANGDIFSAEDARDMLIETGAAAVMVGRGAQGNPWIFSQINELLECGRVISVPSPRERISLCMEHISLLCKLKGEYIGIREARKHASWYIKGLSGAAALRNKINTASCLDEMEKILHELL